MVRFHVAPFNHAHLPENWRPADWPEPCLRCKMMVREHRHRHTVHDPFISEYQARFVEVGTQSTMQYICADGALAEFPGSNYCGMPPESCGSTNVPSRMDHRHS